MTEHDSERGRPVSEAARVRKITEIETELEVKVELSDYTLVCCFATPSGGYEWGTCALSDGFCIPYYQGCPA
jgi:hypothetical protein